MCQFQSPNLSLPTTLFPGNHKFVFYICDSTSELLEKVSYLLRQVLVAACGIFGCGMGTLSCSMWDLVPWPGIEPGPALGARNRSHWTTREVPPSIPEGGFPTLEGISNMLHEFYYLGQTASLGSH